MTNQTSSNIKVCVRCRPFIANELIDMQNKEPPFYINENSIELKNNDPSLTKSMNFDYVFDELSTTGQIYDKLLSEMIPSVCEGYNVTTFAYGQTASGKTFTMKGSNEKPGLIRLAIRDVFNQIKNSEGENRTFLIRVSYLEIYNEKVRDLLSPEQRFVNIFVDKNKNLSFDNLTEEIVRSEQETMDIITRGTSHVMVAKTVANDASSRSHTIFRMIVERKDELSVENSQQSLQSSLTKKTKSKQIVRIGNLNLVDLAGSENSSEQSDVNRKREGQNINLSLLHLKEIITKLSNGEKVTSFRNSKLTRILGDSLGGNARVAVVCAISPDPVKMKESKRTLEFGSNAQKISIKPTMNSECDNALIMKYQTEMETLQSELSMLREKLQNQKTQVEKEETEEELKELERIMSDLTDSMVTNKSLEARLQDVEKEKRDHEERIRQMEEERTKLEQLLLVEEERKRMQEEESKNKEETLYLLQQETASMSLQLEEIVSSKNNIEAESKRRELKIQDLMSFNHLLEQKTINEENSRRRAEEMISDQNKQIEQFKQTNEHFEREYKREKMAKEEASKLIQQKMEEMQNMQQQLSLTRTEKENYELQIKTLNDNMTIMYKLWKDDYDKEISLREQEKNQLDEQIARMTSLMEEQDLQMKKLQENCKTQDYLQHFVDSLEKDLKSYKQRLEVSEIELSGTKKKSLETFRENIELKKKNSALENELEALKLHFMVNFGKESLPNSPKPSTTSSNNFFEANNISHGLTSSSSSTTLPPTVTVNSTISSPTTLNTTVSPTTTTTTTTNTQNTPTRSSTPVVVNSSTTSNNSGTPNQKVPPPFVNSTPPQSSTNSSNSSSVTRSTPPIVSSKNAFNSTPPIVSNKINSTPPPLSNTFSPSVVRSSTPTPTSFTPPQYSPQQQQQQQNTNSLSQQLSTNYSNTNQSQPPPFRPATTTIAQSVNNPSNPFNSTIGGMRENDQMMSTSYSSHNPYEYYPSSNPSSTLTSSNNNSYHGSTNPYNQPVTPPQSNSNFNTQRSTPQYSPTTPNTTSMMTNNTNTSSAATGNGVGGPNRLSINTQNVQSNYSPNQQQQFRSSGLDSPTIVNIHPNNNFSRPQSTGMNNLQQQRHGSLPPSQNPMVQQNNRFSLPQQTNTTTNNASSQSTQPSSLSAVNNSQQSALVRNRPKNFNSIPTTTTTTTTGNLYPTLSPHNTVSSSSSPSTTVSSVNVTPTTTNSHSTSSTATGSSGGGNSRPASPSIYRITGDRAFKAKEEREQFSSEHTYEGPIVGVNEKSTRPKRSLSISKLIGLVRGGGEEKKTLK